MQEVKEMSVEFSAKISMLRKERGITQRQAADELGISQALLSHYEKGIRECSLDFAKRAAVYYGVSADYLLGLTQTKRGLSDLYAIETVETDDTLIPKTALRAILYLSEQTARAGEAQTKFFCDFFALQAHKYALIASGGRTSLLPLYEIAEKALIESRRTERQKNVPLNEKAAAFDTAAAQAEQLLQDTLGGLQTAFQ